MAHSARPTALPVEPPTARVTITHLGGIRVPRSFLGLSTEYWALPLYEGRMTLFERVLRLVHVKGGGPLVVRIGGDSADHAFWYRRPRKVPRWVFALDPALARRTSGLVRRLGLRLILDLNLVTGSPLRAAEWAAAAERELPRRSIVAFEIGNEPDIYSRRYWLASFSSTRLRAPFLPIALTSLDYVRDFHSYQRALTRVAPGVPLVGPALANPAMHVGWISSLLAARLRGLATVSAHRYPLSACALPGTPGYPTIARVLSERTTSAVAQALAPAIRIAHHARLPFRLTELNSVTCGGLPGVSDTFATALWAPDALFELLRARVDGVSVHVREQAINAAFAVRRNGIEARPLLYGLTLFARTLGPDARLVPVRVAAQRGLHLKVWAVSVRRSILRVLLINKGAGRANVALRLPATGSATLQSLLAPSVRSRWGVTLAGQQIGVDGRWHGQRVQSAIAPAGHTYRLVIPPLSAALLSVRVSARRIH
jgi:hypothetical protein